MSQVHKGHRLLGKDVLDARHINANHQEDKGNEHSSEHPLVSQVIDTE